MFSSDSTQVSSAVTYIEDVFSTYLWTSVANTQYNISNGIDLSTKGGMSWLKARSAALNNALFDTVRGAGNFVSSNNTNAESTGSTLLSSFNTDGFSGTAGAAYNYVSWTFRKQPKFFDVVTWTGDDVTTGRQISHSLSSTVGCIIAKRTDASDDWYVWHRGLSSGYWISLNQTSAQSNFNARLLFGNGTVAVDPTSSVFTVGIGLNSSPQTFVAYLFAHDAGGFGLTGTDNVISCGSFTSSGNYPQITLGYEPQWVLIKRTNSATDGDWMLADVMRQGFNANAALGNEATYILKPNTSGAETTGVIYAGPNATGFSGYFGAGSRSFIYIAIRRGPMKMPTSGTSVYQATTYSGNNTNNRSISTNFPVDMFLDLRRNGVQDKYALDRLRGNLRLWTNLTTSESANTAQVPANSFNANQTGVLVSADELNTSTRTYVLEAFRRAPSFFDEVCYLGTGAAQSYTHNLTVAPELIIIKDRTTAGTDWFVGTNFGASTFSQLYLDNTSAENSFSYGTYISNKPTSSIFRLTSNAIVNGSGDNYVAYLFATCAGVSKVGSYTGTGTTLQVDCGFTGGARFIIIKRTDSTGDWYVWDSARGIVAGNDPYLFLNSDAAEVTSTDYVDTYSAGFEISSTAPAAINASGGTFVFLAIA